MKKLLMLGTSNATREIIRCAQSKGIYTIVTDYLPPERSVAKLVADEYWMINTADMDALEQRCRAEGIDAVACGVSEFNQERTLELCKRLGLKTYCTPEAWRYSRDKDIFKRLCLELGVPVAKDYYLSDALTDKELAEVEFPVVVKPVDMCANRGISYCRNRDELVEAFRLVRSVSKNEKIIVERMLHGEEWYSTYAIANGEISLLAINAMYAQPGEPKNCYTITTTASRYVDKYIREINPKIVELLKKVGCTDGIAWVQVMLDEDGHFYIIEMGYRMDGEMMFIPYREVCHFDAIEWMLETALGIEHTGKDLPAAQTKAFTACATGMELWTNKAGTIVEMKGFDELAKIHGVYVEQSRKVGDAIDKYRPVGVITFATKDCEQMCEMIDMVNKKVHVINEKGEDMIIKYTDFDYLREVYALGINGQ